MSKAPIGLLPTVGVDVPQEAQIPAHMGFKPTFIARRSVPRVRPQSAVHVPEVPDPPEWMKRASCHGLWTSFDKPSQEDKPIVKRVCASCPVLEQCRSWVLEVEAGLAVEFRATFVAGMTPWDRVRAHHAMPGCPGCGSTTAPRGVRSGACHDCVEEASRERISQAEVNDRGARLAS